MDMLWFGLQVAVIGMGVVFVGLIVIIGCIQTLKALSVRKNVAPEELPKAEAPPVMPDAPAAPAGPVAPVARIPAVIPDFTPGPRLTPKDGAFYALLTAAIGETLAAEGINPEGGFAIRSVRAVQTPESKKLTQKDDALYAILTAAIAETLAAEGVNPEGGFAITAVTPV